MDQETKPVENYCPFGCGVPDLDEHGYCRHLVGFSNDGKSYEKQVRGARGYRVVQANKFHKGRYTRLTEKVQKTDKLVNPETPQLDQGVVHMAKKWVSDRVYRENVPEEMTPEDEAQLDEATRPVAGGVP